MNVFVMLLIAVGLAAVYGLLMVLEDRAAWSAHEGLVKRVRWGVIALAVIVMPIAAVEVVTAAW
jgi:hypothetical protein